MHLPGLRSIGKVRFSRDRRRTSANQAETRKKKIDSAKVPF